MDAKLADLKARRLELTRASLRETILGGGLETFRVAVDSLADEFDILDVAAAGVGVLITETLLRPAVRALLAPLLATTQLSAASVSTANPTAALKRGFSRKNTASQRGSTSAPSKRRCGTG